MLAHPDASTFQILPWRTGEDGGPARQRFDGPEPERRATVPFPPGDTTPRNFWAITCENWR